MDTFKEENELINRISLNTEDAIQNCLDCFRAASACHQHCLTVGGKYADSAHLKLLMECTEICRVASNFMIASSDFSHDISSLCARICDAVVESCQEIDADDFHMVATMVAARKCAESCRNLDH